MGSRHRKQKSTGQEEPERSRPAAHDAHYEAYRVQAEELNRIIAESTTILDKTLITLSSGAIALSTSFIMTNSDVNQNNSRDSLVLPASWLSYVLCIILVIASFYWSKKACEEAREALDKGYRTGDLSCQESAWLRRLRLANRVSPWLFVAGTVLMLVYFWLNL